MIPKFRAWLKNDKKMIDVRVIDWNNMIVDSFSPYIEIPLEKVIIMQSTGLFDKNGKEIFEGDVVKCSGLLGIIKSFKAMWICSFVKYSNYQKVGFVAKEIEVVGNIHENWELVQEEKDRSCE